jgi:hypothetical protein
MQAGIAFILIAFPVYLLYRNELGTYFSYAMKAQACGTNAGTSNGADAVSNTTNTNDLNTTIQSMNNLFGIGGAGTIRQGH